MSNFICEKCGKAVYDSPDGYVTGCEHYPADISRRGCLSLKRCMRCPDSLL